MFNLSPVPAVEVRVESEDNTAEIALSLQLGSCPAYSPVSGAFSGQRAQTMLQKGACAAPRHCRVLARLHSVTVWLLSLC